MAKHKSDALSDMEIELLLRRFVRGEMRMDEGERAIERFRSAREQVLPHLLRMISHPDESIHTAASELLMALEDGAVVRPLLELLDDPALEDRCKLSIFSVLQHYEAPVDLESLYRRLNDPETLALQSQEDLLNSFTQVIALAQLTQVLTEHVPLETRADMILRLAELGDPRALHLLRVALYMSEETVVLAAIEGLNILRAAVAIPWLEDMALYGPTDLIRQEAGKVAGHLIMRSSISGADMIRQMPPLTDAEWPLHSCWLTTIDGAGGQIAFAVRQRPNGYLVIADIMFNDHEGIKDSFGADMMAEEEFEEILDTVISEGITPVQVSLAHCREAVERAYRQTITIGRQLPMEHFAWEGLLAGEDSQPVEEYSVTAVDITLHPELLIDSIDSLTLEEMESWFFNPEEIQSFANRHYHTLSKPHLSRTRIQLILRQGVETVVDEKRRTLLRDRLLRQAWLLAQVYAEEKVWQWAMAAAAGLGETGVPSGQHPLLIAMMAASLDNMLDTELLSDLLQWEEEVWLNIMHGTASSTTRHTPQSEWAKLCTFLEETRIGVPGDFPILGSATNPPTQVENIARARSTLRTLNWLESVFDDVVDDHLAEFDGLDWRLLRQELGLIPAPEMKSLILQEIEEELVAEMDISGCPPAIITRARQLWDDYILITQGQVTPLRKPESWAAGVEYLVHSLYFEWQTQQEVGELYDVSGATVSKRYRTLQHALGVESFPYAFDKHWQAIMKLEGWDQISAREMDQHLANRPMGPGGAVFPSEHGE